MLTKQGTSVPLNEIEAVTVTKYVTYETKHAAEFSPRDIFLYPAAVALVAEDKIIEKIHHRRYRKVDVIHEDTKQYKGIDQTTIQANAGLPLYKYICSEAYDSPPFEMWEYTDERIG